MFNNGYYEMQRMVEFDIHFQQCLLSFEFSTKIHRRIPKQDLHEFQSGRSTKQNHFLFWSRLAKARIPLKSSVDPGRMRDMMFSFNESDLEPPFKISRIFKKIRIFFPPSNHKCS